MKPAVHGVIIFFFAYFTHVKGFHGSMKAFKRKGVGDRPPGSTIDTGGERIKMTSVFIVDYFTFAHITNRKIRGELYVEFARCMRWNDAEVRKWNSMDILHNVVDDPG